MKLNRKQLRELIREGLMDSLKNKFLGGGNNARAMEGFNQGPSTHKFKLVDAIELGLRKREFLRSLDQTREAFGDSIDEYFSGSGIAPGMIDHGKIKNDIADDISGIDAYGNTHASGVRSGLLFKPGPIEKGRVLPNYIGDPIRGWGMIAKYLSGDMPFNPGLPVKNKDLFAVQQAYAARQLGLV